MPDIITATQGLHRDGSPCVIVLIRGLKHKLTPEEAAKLAQSIESLLCPQCGELLDGDTCQGCGARFEYMEVSHD